MKIKIVIRWKTLTVAVEGDNYEDLLVIAAGALKQAWDLKYSDRPLGVDIGLDKSVSKMRNTD